MKPNAFLQLRKCRGPPRPLLTVSLIGLGPIKACDPHLVCCKAYSILLPQVFVPDHYTGTLFLLLIPKMPWSFGSSRTSVRPKCCSNSLLLSCFAYLPLLFPTPLSLTSRPWDVFHIFYIYQWSSCSLLCTGMSISSNVSLSRSLVLSVPIVPSSICLELLQVSHTLRPPRPSSRNALGDSSNVFSSPVYKFYFSSLTSSPSQELPVT